MRRQLLPSITFAILLFAVFAPRRAECGRGQEYNVGEENEGQKDYSKEEEGKIFPTK